MVGWVGGSFSVWVLDIVAIALLCTRAPQVLRVNPFVERCARAVSGSGDAHCHMASMCMLLPPRLPLRRVWVGGLGT
jgi:hypothetical protein